MRRRQGLYLALKKYNYSFPDGELQASEAQKHKFHKSFEKEVGWKYIYGSERTKYKYKYKYRGICI